MDRFALVLVIIGAIVWGVVGIFGINPVSWILSGTMPWLIRIIYTVIGLAGLWSFKFFFREREIVKHHE
jgi:uncharacterized protein